jgi:hypothetical protein
VNSKQEKAPHIDDAWLVDSNDEGIITSAVVYFPLRYCLDETWYVVHVFWVQKRAVFVTGVKKILIAGSSGVGGVIKPLAESDRAGGVPRCSCDG